MKWIKGNKTWYKSLECVNPNLGIYYVNLSPRDYTPSEEEDDANLEYINLRLNHKPSLFELKNLVLSTQEEYDASSEVNGFKLNGNIVWLDKSTRVGLVNSLTVQKENGDTESTLWLNGNSFTVEIDAMLSFLKTLELYAIQCYNVTLQHIAEINALKTLEELFAYNVSTGYPSLLGINL